MNIIFIGSKGIPAIYGGIEKYVEELSKRMTQIGYDIFVYNRSSYSGNLSSYKNINIKYAYAPRSKYLNMVGHTFFSILKTLFSDRNYDIIHIHGADMAIFSLLAKLKTRVVVTSHGRVYTNISTVPPIMKFFSRIAEYCFLYWPDARIAVSQSLANYYNNKKKLSTKYIPIGIDPNNGSDIAIQLKQFNLKTNNYILFVGRIIPTKRVDLLINAYITINTDIPLVIVGDSPYGKDKYVQNLKKYSSGKIRFLGFQNSDTLSTLYKNCCLFVLPSESEGLPVVLLEALSHGCPVLASDIAANNEVLQNKYGILFKSGSLNDLIDKLNFSLNNIDKLRKMSSAARKYIGNNFSWDICTNKHIELYNSLLGRKKN